MSRSLNKVMLIGNVGKAPEFKAIAGSSGTGSSGADLEREMATFSLATSVSWGDRSSGERNEKTEWHSVMVFSNRLVKIVRDYVRKGSKLYLEGSLSTRKWVDQHSQDRYSTYVILPNYSGVLILLDSSRVDHDGSDQFSSQASDSSGDGGGFLRSPGDQDVRTSNEFSGAVVDDLLDDEIPF